MSVSGIAQSLAMVTIVVPDYAAGLAFFVGTLGFHVVEDTDLGAGKRWVVVSCGEGAKLLLARAADDVQAAAIGRQAGGRVGFFLHTADTNQNSKIDVSELTRVIALYNTRFTTVDGKVRTGSYKLQTATADGFATDTARDPATVVTLAAYHSADYNRNGKIDVADLTRVITLYNTRFTTVDGKVRTGFYKVATTTTVDGYTTDPTRDPAGP